MAKTQPYGSLPHDGFWLLLGQKSCYEKCDRTFFTIATIQIHNTTIAIIEIYGSRVNFSGEYHGWFPTTVTLVILIISLNFIIGK